MSDDDNGCTEAQCQCNDRTTDVEIPSMPVATGEELDALAELVGVERGDGEPDDAFRERVKVACFDIAPDDESTGSSTWEDDDGDVHQTDVTVRVEGEDEPLLVTGVEGFEIDGKLDADRSVGFDVTEVEHTIEVDWDLADFAEECSRIVEEAEQYSKVVENYESDMIVSARGCPECRGQMSVRISATTGEPVEVVHHCRHCGTEIPVDPDEL